VPRLTLRGKLNRHGSLLSIGLALCLFVGMSVYYYLQTKQGADVDITFHWEDQEDTGDDALHPVVQTEFNSAGKLNINKVEQVELQQLPGIGPALALRIVEYRKQNGPFSSVDELLKVSGIGQKTMEKLRPLICVE
jgi:comEA protein